MTGDRDLIVVLTVSTLEEVDTICIGLGVIAEIIIILYTELTLVGPKV